MPSSDTIQIIKFMGWSRVDFVPNRLCWIFLRGSPATEMSDYTSESYKAIVVVEASFKWRAAAEPCAPDSHGESMD